MPVRYSDWTPIVKRRWRAKDAKTRQGRRRKQGSAEGARARKAGELVALTLAAAAGYRHVQVGRLSALPLFDRRTIEAPVAANAKTRQASLAEQAVNRGRMYAQVIGQLLDGEDVVRGSPLRRGTI
jgi:hypothetical protein